MAVLKCSIVKKGARCCNFQVLRQVHALLKKTSTKRITSVKWPLNSSASTKIKLKEFIPFKELLSVY